MVMDTAEFKALKTIARGSARKRAVRGAALCGRACAADTRDAGVFHRRLLAIATRASPAHAGCSRATPRGSSIPIFSTGVFLAIASGEQAPTRIDAVLTKPARAAEALRRYERGLKRVMDLYLRFVTRGISQEFAEVITTPTRVSNCRRRVNAVLAGNIAGGFPIWWRMQLFYLVVFLQRSLPLCPRLAHKATRPSPPKPPLLHALR